MSHTEGERHLPNNNQLERELNHYFDHLYTRLASIQGPDIELRKSIFETILRNNRLARIIGSDEYRRIQDSEAALMGNVHGGIVVCIDGRLVTLFLGGRNFSAWEEPAAIIGVEKRRSDSKIIPMSSILGEAIRKSSQTGKIPLQIVTAHTSLVTDHKCGKMKALERSGKLVAGRTLEQENLRLLEETTIPALENLTNEARNCEGLPHLKRVAVPLVVDTDTMGVILHFDPQHEGNQLSTIELVRRYSGVIDTFTNLRREIFGDKASFKGVYKDNFTNPETFIRLSQEIAALTDYLMKAPTLDPLRREVRKYIAGQYTDFTVEQQRALEFFVKRNISLLYLTGLYEVTDHPHHRFAHHGEQYMSVSLEGKTVGQFDTEQQVFGSSPSDDEDAVGHVKTKISIMDSTYSEAQKPYVLFVCNQVARELVIHGDESVLLTAASNANFIRRLMRDSLLSDLVINGKLYLVPVLIDRSTREVVRITDPSIYF